MLEIMNLSLEDMEFDVQIFCDDDCVQIEWPDGYYMPQYERPIGRRC